MLWFVISNKILTPYLYFIDLYQLYLLNHEWKNNMAGQVKDLIYDRWKISIQNPSWKLLLYGIFLKDEYMILQNVVLVPEFRFFQYRINMNKICFVQKSPFLCFHNQKYTNCFIWKHLYNHLYHYVNDIIYYEIRIIKNPMHLYRCFTLGFTTISDFYKMIENKFMVGWTMQGVGWHSDDGYIYEKEKRICFASYFGQNDQVGIGIDFKHKQCFVTLNGKFLCRAEMHQSWNGLDYYPVMVTDGVYQIKTYHHEFMFPLSQIFSLV